MKWLRAGVVACAWHCAACGANEDSPAEDGCALTIKLTGAVAVQADGSHACGGSGVYPPGPRTVVTFMDVGELKLAFTLDGVSEGATGIFPTVVAVSEASAGTSWSTPGGGCTLEVTQHKKVHEDQLMREYRMGGNGACGVPAEPGPNATGTVEVGNFRVVGMIGWE
ncbi:MAG: hypothetical protein HS104_32730 [Polyangiaceae bacterium]|nr:hypothetical protein [Polyangiaceae bacterium]